MAVFPTFCSGDTHLDECQYSTGFDSRYDFLSHFMTGDLLTSATLQDLVIEKQVIVGHLARRLAKQTESKTHHWEIFL
jgi:hypothetical protein